MDLLARSARSRDFLSAGVVLGAAMLVLDLMQYACFDGFRLWAFRPAIYPSVIAVCMLVFGSDARLAERRTSSDWVYLVRRARWLLVAVWSAMILLNAVAATLRYFIQGVFVGL